MTIARFTDGSIILMSQIENSNKENKFGGVNSKYSVFEHKFVDLTISYFREVKEYNFVITDEKKAEKFADLCRECKKEHIIRNLKMEWKREWKKA